MVGDYLGKFASALQVISFLALIVTIIIWVYSLTQSHSYHDIYDRADLSSIQAFGYVVDAFFTLVGAFALDGFSYIVKAAIRYLDEKGEFEVE